MKLQVGDKVLLFDETVRRGRSRKLSTQWIGPYTITEIDKVNVTITRGHKVTKVHVNLLKPFYGIRSEDINHCVFVFFLLLLGITSELIVLVAWMMLRVTVGNSNYEMTF